MRVYFTLVGVRSCSTREAFRAARSLVATVAATSRRAADTMGLTALALGTVCAAVPLAPAMAQGVRDSDLLGVQVGSPSAQDGGRNYEGLARDGDWGAIDAMAQSALVRQPDNVEALYWLGVARFQSGDTIGALQVLRAAQARGLASAQIHLELGQVYYKLNQFVLFEQQMEEVLHSDLHEGTALYLLGFYQLSVRSDVGRALALLRQAVAVRPEDPKALYELGYCLEMSGELEEAKELYLKAVALSANSKRPFSWPYQGLARLELNHDPQHAVQLATEAVRLEPDEAPNHLVLAKSYERAGDIPKAVREAREAASKGPASASTRYLLYRLYRRMGEATEADQELKMFHEIDAVYGPE